MRNRIKEAFLLDEFEVEMRKNGVDYDEPENIVKRFTQTPRITEMREYPSEMSIPGIPRGNLFRESF